MFQSLQAAATAEQLAVGMALTGQHVVPDDWTPDAFHSPPLRLLATAIHELRAVGSPHGFEEVLGYLRGQDRLEPAGGQSAVLELYVAGKQCTWRALPDVWDQVVDAWGTRRVRLALGEAMQLADRLGYDELISLCYETLSKCGLSRGDSAQSIEQVIRETAKAMQLRSERGGLDGIGTGFPDLDDMTGGIGEGQVCIVAGRPSMGKSAIARSFADYASSQGHGVHVFSLEDTAESYGMRCLADHAGVDLGALRVIGPTTPRHILEQTMQAASRLYSRPQNWLIDDTAGLSSGQIGQRVRKHRPRLGTKLVVIDYVQLIREKDASGKMDEVSMAAESLVRLARDERVAIVLLSQLSRACEQRPDKRPLLSDLRETGVLEQVAHQVLLCYRPEYYMGKDDKDTLRLRGKGAVIVAKNKNGRTGEAWLKWDASTATYRNLSRREGL